MKNIQATSAPGIDEFFWRKIITPWYAWKPQNDHDRLEETTSVTNTLETEKFDWRQYQATKQKPGHRPIGGNTEGYVRKPARKLSTITRRNINKTERDCSEDNRLEELITLWNNEARSTKWKPDNDTTLPAIAMIAIDANLPWKRNARAKKQAEAVYKETKRIRRPSFDNNNYGSARQEQWRAWMRLSTNIKLYPIHVNVTR